MAHAQGFLADILEHPHDDTPRLVYADWLEENGDPERAEFIRVQVALASLPRDAPRRQALERRQEELLARGKARWLAGVPAWMLRDRSETVAFHRGFPGRVWATLGDLVKNGRRLPRCLPVETVHLRNVRIGNLRPLTELPLLRQLTGLDLGLVRRDQAQQLPSWPPLPSLRLLRLACYEMSAADVPALLLSPALSGVTDLRLSWPFTAAEVAALAASPHVSRLRALTLADPSYAADAHCARALAEAPHLAGLKELDLSFSAIGDEGVRILAGSPHLRRLEVLSIRSCRVTDAGVQALAESPHLASLTELSLDYNQVTPEALHTLTASPRLPRLTKVGVRDTPAAMQVPVWEPVVSAPGELWHWKAPLNDA